MGCGSVTSIVRFIAVWKILRGKERKFKRQQSTGIYFICSNTEIDVLGLHV